MADAKDAKTGSGKVFGWSIFVLSVAIAAGASFLHRDSERARAALEDARRDYEEMQQFKKRIAVGKSLMKRLPTAKESGEDMLPFLERKRAQAGIPQSLFSIARNSPVKQGGWTETSYTVTLRGTKDAPIARNSIADFVVAVETERPSVKSKNLSMAFVPSFPDFTTLSITFSQFQRGE